MWASLRALLHGIIDYAGMFPPAKLPLEESIRTYARLRGEREAWILARFICPAARLAELAPFDDELFHTGPPFDISALGRSAQGRDEFLDALQGDAADIAAFVARHGGRTRVGAYEVRLPQELVRSGEAGAIAELIREATVALDRHAPGPFAPFFESPPPPDDNLEAIVPVLAGIAESRARGDLSRCAPPGFKLRTGGTEAPAFPSAHSVAFVIGACRDRELPLKFTAGLHHPLRRHDESLDVMMHGFLNVFMAGFIAAHLKTRWQDLVAVLETESPFSFRFAEKQLTWRDLGIPTPAILQFRRDRLISFGSCSFDEPREGLRAAGFTN